ncbi:diguanylate cyclase [Breoghania corrubedonensis]|uniref:diguanylate cyclase n=1 Tax=Breoghania corrubedonensis TaxID=665038 RepID=A0A2T5V9X4_9HYPH|nr:GGDEF domain-containing protein [Breoghania corrubedonensis]PTW60557.1 diguanylate cyclase [Breoghania corrubedonensis]
MSQRDDFKRTIVYGDTALAYLKKNELPAYPRNYELWYTYSAGFNYSLNKAVNDILGKKGGITPDEVQNVYNRFLCPNRLSDRIDSVGSRLSEEIGEVLEIFSAGLSANSKYAEALGGVTKALEHATTREQFSEIISTIVAATNETVSHNRKLEEQLYESNQQISGLQESLEAIRFESLTDELTTLANRRHFDEAITRAVRQAGDVNEPLSLLLTDIDHFKQFNDNYGHQTGDQVLRLVGLSVKQNVKAQDIACRYGGEEFAVILPRSSMEQAYSVAEHIRKSVICKELVKRSTGENLGRITISIGVASFRPGDTPNGIIGRADAALYSAKRAGRNLVKCERDLDIEAAVA